LADFSKTNIVIKFLPNLALFWVKSAISADFIDELILKILTSVPGSSSGAILLLQCHQKPWNMWQNAT
jgi:uncharacterized membrane protein YqaE (UPF0057 family)